MWLDSEQWYRIRELDQALAKRTRKHFYSLSERMADVAQ